METCFADAQPAVFAFQAPARHPGGSISRRSFGELAGEVLPLEGGGARGEVSPHHRFVFPAGRLPGGRGRRCSSVHRSPREPLAGGKGQAGRRGGQPTVLFGLATLVSRARSTRPCFYHISSSWTPSIQSWIWAERKALASRLPRL